MLGAWHGGHPAGDVYETLPPCHDHTSLDVKGSVQLGVETSG